MFSLKPTFRNVTTLLMVLATNACANTDAKQASSFSASEKIPNIEFEYTGNDKNLAISGAVCRYGRSSKSQLPEFTIKEVHQYVQQNSALFTQQIKDIKQGMMGQRLNIAKLSVFYRLKQDNINFDYFVDGNQICANYQTSLTLDFEQDFVEFIKLNVPSSYQFISNNNEVTEKLSSIYPDIAITLQNNTSVFDSKYLTTEKKLNNTSSVFTFHYLDFKKQLMQNQSMVFVSGDKILTKALTQYLQENEFTLATSPTDAFWSFDISNEKATSSQKDISRQDTIKEFAVTYKKSNTEEAGTFVNDSSVLPQLKTKTEEQKINLIKLYLEMMELAQQIRER